jgi:Peptidase family M28
MKLATYQVPPNARGKGLDLTLPSDASWLRFGNDVLLFAEDAQWKGAADRARKGNLQRQNQAITVKKERLHIVVQNGRLFQQEHPEIPVILDRGRFLLVELDPGRARRLGRKSLTCYGVLPLGKNKVVFDVQERTSTRAAPTPWIRKLVDKVSATTFKANLTHLVSFPTRFSTSAHYAKASAAARTQLQGMGYTTRFQNITVNGGASRNVIAEKKGGAAGARKAVVVTAHLDSINLQGGPTANAPGADDNGSGSAGLLEMARVLRDHRSKHDLRFILFGGEEEGLFGSKHYVAKLSAAERKNSSRGQHGHDCIFEYPDSERAARRRDLVAKGHRWPEGGCSNLHETYCRDLPQSVRQRSCSVYQCGNPGCADNRERG